MVYSQTWDAAYNNTPAGGAQLSGGDDAIRNLKRDIYERLLKIMTDINADPPTLLASVLGTIGAQTNHIMSFGPHILEGRNDEDDTDHQDAYFGMNTSGLSIVGSLYLPTGITIKKLEASMDKGLAADCSCELFKINLTTGVKSSLDTALRNVAGIGISAGAIANPPGIADVVDSTNYVYGIKFTAAAWAITGPKFYGLRLTVDSPGVTALP